MDLFKAVYWIGVLRKYSTKMKVINMAPIIDCCRETSPGKAAEYLAKGEVIAVPTDTIYGLACSANCPDAIRKLYSIKGRDAGKPVAICVSTIADVRKWGEAEHLPDSLLTSILPGPVTVVLQKTARLNNPHLNPITTKIGIRIPKCSFINDMTKIFGMPMALSSANFSSEPSTLSVGEFEHLYGYLGAVFDGGVLSKGLEVNRTGSTVIDMSEQGFYKVIRKGISYENIVNILKLHGLKNML